MITPSFKLQQDHQFLSVIIRAPYTNIKNTEVVYDEQSFLFVSKPYFLRLFLPKEVVDDDTGTSDYNSESGVFTFKVPKKHKGEHFPNLEMLNELLKPQRIQNPIRPLIEEVGPSNKLPELTENGDELFADQTVVDEGAPTVADLMSEKYGYGFAWHHHNVFSKFEEIQELIDLKDYELSLVDERCKLCEEFDKTKFNSDHYLADLFDPDEYIFDECLNFELPKEHFLLTDEDRDRLKNLRILKLFKLNSELQNAIAYSLLDILCSYFYDFRITIGQHSVESGWTIKTLSPSLSFLIRWANPKDAVIGYVRKSLTYPLIRNWQFTLKTLNDVKLCLLKDRTAILKCLVDIHKIFNENGESYYLFNQLFIEELIIWIQCVDNNILKNISNQYVKVLAQLNKESVELDLELLEAEAQLTMMKVKENKELSNKQHKLKPQLDSDDSSNDDG